MYGVLATGLTFSAVEKLFAIIGIPLPFKESSFYKRQKRMIPKIAQLRNSLLDQRCREISTSQSQGSMPPIRISIDGRWSSRRNAMEGTVTCFNSSNNQIIGVQHCIQDRSRQINQIEPLNG